MPGRHLVFVKNQNRRDESAAMDLQCAISTGRIVWAGIWPERDAALASYFRGSRFWVWIRIASRRR